MRRAAALMRSVVLGLVATVAAWALPAAGQPARAEPCAWRDDPTAPAFATPGRMAVYQRTFTCPGTAHGTWELRFEAVVGGLRKAVDTKKGKVEARGRWMRETAVHDPLAPSQFCPETVPPAAPIALGPDSSGLHREPTFGVELGATFRGTGDLAKLERTEHATVLCPACPAPRHGHVDIGVYQGRAMVSTIAPGVRLRARVERTWFECARRDATLEVRWFTGDDDRSLQGALRPVFVQSGLEKQLRVQGDDASFDLPVPVERLCKHPARRVTWEVSGEGLLARLGGGGRSYHDLKCR